MIRTYEQQLEQATAQGIKSGDIVEISGAYFKNDNGLYYVHRSPGDASWTGSGYCCYKISKGGKISTAKNNICFWPIMITVNSRDKRAAAKSHNAEYAQIKKITGVPRHEVAAAFRKEAADCTEQAERRRWDWGEDHPETARIREYAAFYERVAARIEQEDAPKQEQPEQPTPAVEQAEQAERPATGYRIEQNSEYNSIEIFFDEKPAAAVRDALKALRFRWHRQKRCWYGRTDEQTARAAIEQAQGSEQAEQPEEAAPTPPAFPLRDDIIYKGRRYVLDTRPLPAPYQHTFETMLLDSVTGYDLESRQTEDSEQAARNHAELLEKYTRPEPPAQPEPIKPLPAKYQKLSDDLKEAIEQTAELEQTEDGGTCNHDSPALRLPRWNEQQVKQAAEQAGARAWKWSCYGNPLFVLGFPTSGQANRRSRRAEAIGKLLTAKGYEVTQYCAID